MAQARPPQQHGSGTSGGRRVSDFPLATRRSAFTRAPRPANESSVAMYLVELRPGKEELYRTGDELAAAIRSGDVDIQSRIYHRATSKWISITMHPQYKAIAAQRQPEPAPLPPLERTSWTFFNAAAETLEGAADSEPSADDDTPRSGRSEGGPMHPWRRPLALSVTGLLLLLGIELSSSAPPPPWSPKSLAPRSAGERIEQVSAPAAEADAQVSLASSSSKFQAYARTEDLDPETASAPVAAPAVPAAVPARVKPPFDLPVAPAIRTKQL